MGCEGVDRHDRRAGEALAAVAVTVISVIVGSTLERTHAPRMSLYGDRSGGASGDGLSVPFSDINLRAFPGATTYRPAAGVCAASGRRSARRGRIDATHARVGRRCTRGAADERRCVF